MSTPMYESARAWFVRERDEEPPVLAAPGVMTVAKRDCAGWWRRAAAFGIDIVLVLAIINSFVGNGAPPVSVSINNDDEKPAVTASHASRKTPKPEATDSQGPIRWGPITVIPSEKAQFKVGPFVVSPRTLDPNNNSGKTFWFAVYMALLVSVAGQTFGMMIAGLRVVTKDFRRPRVWQTIFRYAIVFFLWWLIVPISFFARHVFLHDRWTKTRLVKVERVVARATGSN
jgi:hypothetical protein